MWHDSESLTLRAVELLDSLISSPSLSRNEETAAEKVEEHLARNGAAPVRVGNNVYAFPALYNPARPTLLLNSHIDTVKPAAGYTLDPFTPLHRDGKIYGLGSNDAGASVVSLTETFLSLQREQLAVNLLLALSAEEEVSGKNGMEALLSHFRENDIKIDMAIVGEPTSLEAAIGERGLLVLDGVVQGRSGHAARNEGINAIYKAIDDIDKLRNFRFDKTSSTLGEIKVTVTQIEAGTQHNVVPGECRFVVDVRTTDAYTNAETADILQGVVESSLTPRSTRLAASVIGADHPLVKAATALGAKAVVSPTLSDRALMHGIPALKIGPGDSARSHTADEYIYEKEITDAITFYHKLITSL